MDGYELSLRILEGGFEHEGPTTHARSYFVEVSIDGEVRPEDHTNQVKFSNGKLIWNKLFVKTLKSLETPIPSIISLTMYKHMLVPGFQNGIKLVGSSHICLTDLIPIVNKPAVKGKIHLNMRKRAIARGSYLILEIEVKRLGSDDHNYINTKIPFSTMSSIKLPTLKEEDEEENLNSGVEEALSMMVTTTVSSSCTSWYKSAKLCVPLLLIIVMMILSPTPCSLVGVYI